ncbi:hypothetical protein F2Q70_00015256 [Brassica cretica]|uniref:Uncharacterized protein n=1 Tax=Brassica cretica TaxID=69181 RepID=A0A8S9I2U8_BRACR|nr:hypothetical protein F2Q70_00015256 [Brassica cretica]
MGYKSDMRSRKQAGARGANWERYTAIRSEKRLKTLDLAAQCMCVSSVSVEAEYTGMGGVPLSRITSGEMMGRFRCSTGNQFRSKSKIDYPIGSRFKRETEPLRVGLSLSLSSFFSADSELESMPPRSRLSREEKGKDIATSPSPTRDVTANGSPLDEFDLIHRDALRDTFRR